MHMFRFFQVQFMGAYDYHVVPILGVVPMFFSTSHDLIQCAKRHFMVPKDSQMTRNGMGVLSKVTDETTVGDTCRRQRSQPWHPPRATRGGHYHSLEISNNLPHSKSRKKIQSWIFWSCAVLRVREDKLLRKLGALCIMKISYDLNFHLVDAILISLSVVGDKSLNNASFLINGISHKHKSQNTLKNFNTI